jgi:ribosome-associated heat shock protein Hsp15
MSVGSTPTEDDADDADDRSGGTEAGQRLDKWLWFVRVIKSRTQAAGLVTDGKVRVNRQRVEKPSQTVRHGDVVTVSVRGRVRVLKVLAAGERRGPASEARALFEELTPPSVSREQGGVDLSGGGTRAPGEGRPTKKERRQLDRLRQRHED